MKKITKLSICAAAVFIVIFCCMANKSSYTAVHGKSLVSTLMPASDAYKDSDGDGLSDIEERNKYFTDPNNPDTDGDGIPDGNWAERREYAYTVEERLTISKPYDIKAMNDYYQDVRIVKDNGGSLTIDAVFYIKTTFSGEKDYIENPKWKNQYTSDPKLKEYLRSGLTVNYDAEMQRDLLKELANSGIYPDKLTDRQLVMEVMKWYQKSGFKELPYTGNSGTSINHIVSFDKGGRPYFEDRFKRLLNSDLQYINAHNKADRIGKRPWTAADVLSNEFYGKQMYYNRTVGDCTSQPTLDCTIFRALGIPARIVSVVEPLNYCENDIKDTDLKKRFLKSRDNGAWEHHYCEVLIGNRWVRFDNMCLLDQKEEIEKFFETPALHYNTTSDFACYNWPDNYVAKYYDEKEKSIKYTKDNFLIGLEKISDNYGIHMK